MILISKQNNFVVGLSVYLSTQYAYGIILWITALGRLILNFRLGPALRMSNRIEINERNLRLRSLYIVISKSNWEVKSLEIWSCG